MNPITILFVVAATSASAIPALPVLSQYHAQDELGQYSYGYAGGPSSKHETKTVDGVTRGAFSYVDSNGLIQSRSYVSDPVNGFRVAASDVPDGHPEVLVAPSSAVVAAPTVVASAPVVSTYSAPAPAPVVSTYSAAAPVISTYTAAVPAVVPATSTVVAAGTHSQYHTQDILGQYHYGYSGGSSAKDEVKTADGVTRGAFSYIDGHGLVQTRSYVADDINGFRVAASDLPVGPAPVAPVAPVSVAPAAFVPVAPVASVPVAPVASVPVAPVASVPVAPVDSSVTGAVLQPAEAPAASLPVASAEAPASDASSDSVVVDSA